jgi:hypothetical protein
VSDRGSEFTSRFWTSLSECNGSSEYFSRIYTEILLVYQ